MNPLRRLRAAVYKFRLRLGLAPGLDEPAPRGSQQLGDWGERMARCYLALQGLRIVACQYHAARGEVDLVVKEGATWVFVEVKTRRSTRFGQPAEAVTRDKQKRIAQAAVHFLTARKLGLVAARFDVVEVVARPEQRPQIGWRRGAFEAPEWLFLADCEGGSG